MIIVTVNSCEKKPVYEDQGNGSSGGTGNGGGNTGGANAGGSYGPMSTSCTGYWVCFSNSFLTNIFYSIVSAHPYGAAAVGNNKIFFAGGHEEGGYYGGAVSNVTIYDPALNSWVYAPEMLSVPRSRLAGVGVDNTIIFAGGNNSYATNPVYSTIAWSYYSTVDIYNAYSLAHHTATLSEPRAYLSAATCNNKAWFIGGKNSIRFSDRIDVYDPQGNSWSQLNMPRTRGHGGAAAAGNIIFIGGGQNETGNLRIVDVYNVITNEWSTITAPHEHPYASMVMLNNKIIIAGGDGVLNRSVDIYEIESNTWTSATLTDSRFDMAVGIANNKIVYLSGNYSDAMDVYDDETGTWSSGVASPVTGGACGSLGNRCYFGGLLMDRGNRIGPTLVIIEP